MKSFKQHLDETGRCWPGYEPVPGKKKHELGSCRKEEVELQEGRPSQRHPLEGHEYHRKSNAELVHIAKDAHEAAEAMKGHNTTAENKYRDQANDSATVRYYRQKHGMQDWYKKKYGHVNEEVEIEEEVKKDDKIKQRYLNRVPKQPKGDYERKVEKYLKKKYTKEEVELTEKQISVKNTAGKILKVASQFKDTYVKHGYKPVPGTRTEEVELEEERPGLWANIRAKRARGERMRKPGEKGAPTDAQIKSIRASEEVELVESEAWTRKEGQNPEGGLNRKGIESYRRANPGSKLSMAVTTKPSKLKPGSKAANRRKSFCSRMGGLKRKLTSSKTANDPNSRVNKALRKWNC